MSTKSRYRYKFEFVIRLNLLTKPGTSQNYVANERNGLDRVVYSDIRWNIFLLLHNYVQLLDEL